MDAQLRPGELVTSTAGRDAGRRYIVVKRLEDGFVAVADGESRRIRSPKRKNVKHLRTHSLIDEELGEALAREERVADQRLRESLERLSEALDVQQPAGGEGE